MLALGRSSVHLLPILVSITIITINLKGVFIGIDFDSRIQYESINLALLQTAAKFQELLIVSSLATTVFQLTRDELLYSDGLPLGLLSAGIDFTRLSFFWSSQLLGSLRSLFIGPGKYRKIQLAIFLFLAGILAVLAGPACAVLLVPQPEDWPVGGTPITLNGTVDDFWPVVLTANLSHLPDCSSPTGTRNGLCPSAGYQSLWSHYSRLDNSTYRDFNPPYAANLSGNHYYWSIDSMPPVSTRTISLGDNSAFIAQPHLSASIILDQLMKDWWTALLSRHAYKDYQIDDRQGASSKIYSPLARARCGPAGSLSPSNQTIQFPTSFDEPAMNLQWQNISSGMISDTPTNHLQFSWFPLPTTFKTVTTGAVLQSAWNADNQSRLVVGCSISAHWVPANIRSDSYSFWQGWYPKAIWFGDIYPQQGGQLFNGTGNTTLNAIAVDKSWLDALTPPTPMEGPGHLEWNPSTIESILSSVRITDDLKVNRTHVVDEWHFSDNSNRPGLLASVIASIFADGLSRAGVDKLYEAHGDPSRWTLKPYNKKEDFNNLILAGDRALNYPTNDDMFSIEFTISGLNYKNSLAKRLAMAVLLSHMAFALLHTVWTTARGKSSACWDSITEIMTLAQNSRPAFRALENTAAGLQSSSTFAKKVNIRPTKLSNVLEADHLELLLKDEEASGGNELAELPPTLIEARVPEISTSIEIDEGLFSIAKVLHPSTWPSYRKHGRSPTTPLGYQQSRSPSATVLPLLTPPDQDSRTASTLQVQDDHAYA